MAYDGTHVKFGVIEEVTRGTTPASAVQLVNVTGPITMTRGRQTGAPNVATGDRRTHADEVLQETGQITAPVAAQYENDLLFWEGLFTNDRGAAVSVAAATIGCNSTTGVIDDSGNGLGSIQDGDWVYVGGFADTLNNGWKGPVTSAAAGSITVPASQINSTEAAGPSVTIKTRRLLDGSTDKYFSAEWQATKLTTAFRSGTGFAVASGSRTWRQGSFIDQSFELIGNVPADANATIGTGGPTAAPTSSIMTAAGRIGSIWINEVPTSMVISQIGLSVQGNVNAGYGVTAVGPAALTFGSLRPEISLTALHDDAAQTFLATIEAHSTAAIAWDEVDSEGNRLLWHFGAAKPNDGNPSPGGVNSQSEMSDIQLVAHDPAKDSGSAYNASGFGYQAALYFVTA